MIGEHDKEHYIVINVFTDENGKLASSTKINGKEKSFRQQETIQLLKELDQEKFDYVNLTSNTIRIKAEDALVVIYDLKDMYRRNVFELMPNTMPLIKREITRHNRKVAQERRKKNQQRGQRRVVATALALVLLTGTTIGLNIHRNKADDITITTVQNDPRYSENVDNIIGAIEESSNREDVENIIDELEQQEVINATYLDFNQTRDLEKKNYAYDNYYDIVQDEAIRYGISPNLPMAMLTQESGGKEDNLMQIEFEQWKDMRLQIYNFLEDKYDYFVLTDNPENYNGTKYQTISRKDILDTRTNIRLGCAMLRKSAEMVNYHILAGVQCYNLGIGNMQTVLTETSKNTGQTIDEILSDQTNTTFVDYTHIPGVGDKDYLSHVFQYLDEDDTAITFKHRNSNGEIITEEITLYNTAEKGLH